MAATSLPPSLIALIYEAALDSSLWSEVISCSKKLVDATAGSLITPLDSSYQPLWAADDVALKALPLYVDYYHSCEIFAEPVRQAGFLPVFLSDQHMADSEIEESEYYRDFLRHFGLMRLSSVTCGDRSQDGLTPLFSLSLFRPRDAAPFGDVERNQLLQLHDHIDRALRLTVRNARSNFIVSSLDAVSCASGMAVCLLNGHGLVVYCNAEADRLFAQDDGLSLRNRKLWFASSASEKRWQLALSNALGGHGRQAIAAAFSAPRPSGKRDYLITLTPRAADIGAGTCRVVAAIVVQISSNSTELHRQLGALRFLFKLSPAELLLCESLGQGADLKSYAEQAGISYESARTYLKSIFRKTGCRRQSELQQLLTQVAAVPVSRKS